ncbi:hydrolase, partial [Oryctes borbonicus]
AFSASAIPQLKSESDYNRCKSQELIMSCAVLLFVLLIRLISEAYADNVPLIETSNGWLQGTLKKSYAGRTFASFEGVPFAAPPIGELRFEAPQEPHNWTGTWIADTTHKCLQSYKSPKELGAAGEEDCLYVNVYVPRTNPNPLDNLNVLVHIHGGAWMLGSGDFYAGPDYLMDEEVILVTINYRLGPFGFLSTEDEVQPGNNGLKDQVQSLKWIQKNIKYFGGNPDSVTITGMSAGGASVHYLYLSHLSRGLFHRGISQSGTAINPWALQEASLDKAKRLAALMGCPTTNSKEIIKCLKLRNGNQIAEVVTTFLVYDGFPFSPFGPVVEVEHEGAFLTEHPYKLLTEGKIADLPWITSVTEREGIYPGAFFGNQMDQLDREFEQIAPHVLDYNYTLSEAEKASITQKIRKHYFKESINLHDFITLCGDRHFKVEADIAARLQTRANKSPVYFYVLGYRGQRSFSEIFLGTKHDIGPSHADDVIYYLKTFLASSKLTESDEEMKSIYMQWILSFSNDSKPKIKNVEWE